ncbi:MAG: TIGR02710 family CRISPR-associated CARF protein [Nitrososphaerota archaeon]|nr:TIGR02710 family CRISPR-associated CARF protein [Candidatus Bathyarchaeota archaeon]MDW8193862.1 TIGR02710 family CRISPR-associated CARF protein [Nitrososphaerota archaeon]
MKHHNAEKIFFIASKQSRKDTLPKIFEKAKLQKQEYEVIEIDDPDNVQSIYETVGTYLQKIRAKFDNIVVDYTSGTKAMAAALAILATVHEADELSYITGKRQGGIVQPGTERVMAIQPYFATTEQKIKLAVQFFNRSQYNAAISVLTQIQNFIRDQTIINRIRPLLQLAKAYAQWDKFQHQNAHKIILKLKIPQLNHNKRFLGQLINKLKRGEEPETYLIADLINNAQRRAEKEQKYDDAVARLYRTMELIAQYKLKSKYGIDPANAETKQIQQQLLEKWNTPPEAKTLKLTLEKDYQLLKALGDEIGQKYAQDKKLKDLLSKRNASILAHGLQPINKHEYTQLYNNVKDYAKTVIPNLTQLLADSKFIKWKTTI